MKKAVAPASAALALLGVLVLAAGQSRADALPRWLITGGQFEWLVRPDWGTRGTHPRKALRAEMIVDPSFLKSGGSYLFCFSYSRWRRVNRPNRGLAKATVEVIKSTGEQMTVAELSAKVADHYASDCSSWIDAPLLDLGDVILFRFKFRKMPPLDPRSQGATFSGWVQSAYLDLD